MPLNSPKTYIVVEKRGQHCTTQSDTSFERPVCQTVMILSMTRHATRVEGCDYVHLFEAPWLVVVTFSTAMLNSQEEE